MPTRSFAILLALAAAAVAVAPARADSLLDRARQRGKLIAGVDYVVPAYAAGAKFRTPESVQTALAEELAKRLNLELATVPAQGERDKSLPKSLPVARPDLALAALADADPLRRKAQLVPTGYTFGAMAIMRSDTDIKSWEQLKGRKVCVVEGSPFAGTLAARYGAAEMRFKAPADSLLSLRTGKCDAAVHDSAMLEEMIKMPEWKKFSARLPTGPRLSVEFVLPADDEKAARFVRQVAADWQKSGYLAELTTRNARSIAFEVYLDQDVPDCH